MVVSYRPPLKAPACQAEAQTEGIGSEIEADKQSGGAAAQGSQRPSHLIGQEHFKLVFLVFVNSEKNIYKCLKTIRWEKSKWKVQLCISEKNGELLKEQCIKREIFIYNQESENSLNHPLAHLSCQ